MNKASKTATRYHKEKLNFFEDTGSGFFDVLFFSCFSLKISNPPRAGRVSPADRHV